ncbi:MAG: DNA-processing protein DprA [Bacteroidaceae bacterium]|nr:DNA-processing protein DprA [Bacteroidaceae bacterium]
MTDQELLYTMALTLALRQQSKHQRTLLHELGSATAVYENRRDLGQMLGRVSDRMAEALSGMDALLPRCEQELTYARDHHIRILCLQDEGAYPARLSLCDDAPLILYALGNADLNAQHIVSIVGTRRCTERGRELCEHLARGLAEKVPGTLIISGLAYGIDVAAHRAALANGLSTVGVLAHGLDEIYPRTHRQTAIEMLNAGGLLTEFMSRTPIDRLNFLQRNRIVAGIADATIVVESPARGGSLNTARLAGDYNREVFTFPGRPTDTTSEGYNLLIRRNAAVLITSVNDLLTDLGWNTTAKSTDGQKTLFPELTAEEQTIVDALLAHNDELTLAELANEVQMPTYQVMPILINMEMKEVVKLLAGSRVHLFKDLG